MYSIGEKIMYGGTGVCIVEDITTLSIPGVDKKRQYYVLRPLYQSGMIQTPVDNTKIPIRPVLSQQEAEALVDSIPKVSPVVCNEKNLSALRNHYQTQLSSFLCNDLVEMAVSIYEKKRLAEKNQKKIGLTDEKFLHRAEDLLFGELAVALNIHKDDVQGYILERLKNKA